MNCARTKDGNHPKDSRRKSEFFVYSREWNHEEELETAVEEVKNLKMQLLQMQNEKELLHSQLLSSKSEIKRLGSEKNNMSEKLDTLEKKYIELQKDLDSTKSEVFQVRLEGQIKLGEVRQEHKRELQKQEVELKEVIAIKEEQLNKIIDKSVEISSECEKKIQKQYEEMNRGHNIPENQITENGVELEEIVTIGNQEANPLSKIESEELRTLKDELGIAQKEIREQLIRTQLEFIELKQKGTEAEGVRKENENMRRELLLLKERNDMLEEEVGNLRTKLQELERNTLSIRKEGVDNLMQQKAKHHEELEKVRLEFQQIIEEKDELLKITREEMLRLNVECDEKVNNILKDMKVVVENQKEEVQEGRDSFKEDQFLKESDFIHSADPEKHEARKKYMEVLKERRRLRVEEFMSELD